MFLPYWGSTQMIGPEPLLSAAPSALDLDLIRKYSIPGPRYTSYPPATKFTADLAALRRPLPVTLGGTALFAACWCIAVAT